MDADRPTEPINTTLSEYQRLDKRNFRKRILARELIEETGEFFRNGNHRPAKTYRSLNPERVVILK